ncbi:hypothetical protein CB0940_04988 [Cercospora beticola]|uniref:Uncharacterized protein n=1 Tax=Cercospora beticola TaxID=122368 RepID=A0A2G5HN07_CERBT|nr:hypothetical protein CB0940_04988 [Cercospora beticola]PIA93633.1 hypothetical protein CB0940_04988 [Cercospora beticola]CAK1362852.1 unnamed protein product [Cercospora beticola]
MPSNRALHSSVISLQSDLPFLLGRRAVVPNTATKPLTTTATSNNLDKIATTALKAKAVEISKSASGQSSNAQQNSTTSTPSSVSAKDTFSTWRQTEHWSDGIVRPSTQEMRSAPSPHWATLPRGVVPGVGRPQQQASPGK